MHQHICPDAAACAAMRCHIGAALHAAHMPAGRLNPIRQGLKTTLELIRNCAEDNQCGELSSVKLETAEGTIGL